jgi:glutaconate CoA-transferase subunit B
MLDANTATRAELMTVACAEVWRGNGEVLASGIGVVPRLGASLAKLTHTPELLMTDSETFLVEEPYRWGRVRGVSRSIPETCHSSECSSAFGAASAMP